MEKCCMLENESRNPNADYTGDKIKISQGQIEKEGIGNLS